MITHYDMITGEVIATESPHEAPIACYGVRPPVPRLMTVQEAAALHPVAPRHHDAVVMQPIRLLCKAQE